MSQTNENPCNGPMVELPVCSLKLAVSKSAFDGIGGGGGTPGDCSPLDLRIGVETGTNSLYMGKPVYSQLFDFGPLPNKSTKTIEHGIPNVDWIKLNEVYSTVFFQMVITTLLLLVPLSLHIVGIIISRRKK